MSSSRISQISKERWDRIAPILDAALDAGSAEERRAVLDLGCGDDTSLRADVERLLEAEDRAGSFLEPETGPGNLLQSAIASGMPTAGKDVPVGAIFGSYRVIEPLGRGGMGAVYIAERVDGEFEQRVALKVVRGDVGSADLLRRFLGERQTLARLQHPHIAALLDGGRTADGTPWFAMELIDGEPITDYCTSRDLDVDRRLHFFVMVCDAVRAAHRANIVHRDLKPSNILVTADGYVKLLDFGISKELLDGVDAKASIGTRVLTPEYAAPEQVLGGKVSRRTDIYSLGTVLYELLSGVRAHRFEADRYTEYVQVVCRTDPPLPSAALANAAAGDATASRRAKTVRGDLDAIVMTMLSKDPAQRYESLDAVVDAIEKFRAGTPIGSGEGMLQRIAGWLRR